MELKISHLSKQFGSNHAVDDVSYTLRGGVYGLLGVNGAGKTTLMRMLTTLIRPTVGSITWDGEDIFRMDENYRKRLGYLPQDYGAYPEFTVQEYLSYIATLKGIRPAAARKKVGQVLEQVGLQKARNKKMKTLSGGMKRRAGIAQAILNDPQILILDEPTAGLDPRERIHFRNLISELAQDRIVLLSTHIVSDVASIASQILLMKDGRFLSTGTVESLIAACPEQPWQCTCTKAQAAALEKRYKVANVAAGPNGVVLRLLAAERPAADAVLKETTLEDVFLSCMGQRSGDDDDSL